MTVSSSNFGGPARRKASARTAVVVLIGLGLAVAAWEVLSSFADKERVHTYELRGTAVPKPSFLKPGLF